MRRCRPYWVLVFAACAHRTEAPPPRAAQPAAPASAPAKREPPWEQVGEATWYGAKLAGHRTADGERFDPRQMTAAHRTLPFGTWVEVTRVDNGMHVRVRITDRGPWGHPERIIDLSRAAADRLGMRRRGMTRVSLRVVAGP
jgi:rare lipoprotein A